MTIYPKYYGGYGSNLDQSQMATRCPASKIISGVFLLDWQLVFRGVADISPMLGRRVPFGIYEITEECEGALDYYEGYPDLYTKIDVDVRINGAVKSIFTYTMAKMKGVGPPFEGYFNVMRQGYDDWGFDYQPLIKALEYSVENKENTAYVSERWNNTQIIDQSIQKQIIGKLSDQ
ncbi:MAG: hypothetical protein CFH06_00818 [Alphaproteobacteria bacterium MarineAlpha3_Bin5]|nr:MAG: hypothetical protein CFH06_00818 [Alphaproteobacteria bacterium MarineAlpha3_Bin5]